MRLVHSLYKLLREGSGFRVMIDAKIQTNLRIVWAEDAIQELSPAVFRTFPPRSPRSTYTSSVLL